MTSETTSRPGRNFGQQAVEHRAVHPEPAACRRDPDRPPRRKHLTLADRWILSRAQATIRDATGALEQFRLDEAAKRCYEFVWNELADWYVEAVKPRLAGAADAPPRRRCSQYCL